jgi:hypothetical protein
VSLLLDTHVILWWLTDDPTLSDEVKTRLGVVRFAAPDPMWQGIERLPHLYDQMARRWTDREGPLGGHL